LRSSSRNHFSPSPFPVCQNHDHNTHATPRVIRSLSPDLSSRNTCYFSHVRPPTPFLLCTMSDRTLANNLLRHIIIPASSRGDWPGHPTSVRSLLGARSISLSFPPFPMRTRDPGFLYIFFPGLKRTLAARKAQGRKRINRLFFTTHTFDRLCPIPTFPVVHPAPSPSTARPHDVGNEEGRVKWGGPGVNGQDGQDLNTRITRVRRSRILTLQVKLGASPLRFSPFSLGPAPRSSR